MLKVFLPRQRLSANPLVDSKPAKDRICEGTADHCRLGGQESSEELLD